MANKPLDTTLLDRAIISRRRSISFFSSEVIAS